MRAAPTLNGWMMPFSSVAMIEKLALVRIAFCRASATFTLFSMTGGALASKQLTRGLERLDVVEDHLGDGHQRRAEQQPPHAPQPAEEQQRDEQYRGVHPREPAVQPGHERESDHARHQNRRAHHC